MKTVYKVVYEESGSFFSLGAKDFPKDDEHDWLRIEYILGETIEPIERESRLFVFTESEFAITFARGMAYPENARIFVLECVCDHATPIDYCEITPSRRSWQQGTLQLPKLRFRTPADTHGVFSLTPTKVLCEIDAWEDMWGIIRTRVVPK